jgi:hypothetical protein
MGGEQLLWVDAPPGERFPWLDAPLARPSTVRRLEVGERTALFCERAQKLFELNLTADLIWRGLAEGRPPRSVARELQGLGVSPEEAMGFVAGCAAGWLQAGLLLPTRAARLWREAPATDLQLRIDGLTCSLALYVPDGDPLRGAVHAAFGQFATGGWGGAAAIAVVEDAGRYFLLLDGAPAGLFGPERIVPELKALLTDQLARSVGGGAFLLHAALLARGERGLLLAGPPGAGKTTLTVALASRGLAYGSDDIVRVSPAGRLEGAPFSPACKSGSWELLQPYLPAVADLPTAIRRDGQPVRYAPAAAFAPAAPETLGWAVLLARRPGARAALEPVDPLAMLTELLGAAFSADHVMRGDALQSFAERFAAADCRRLVYSELGEAVAALEALTGA